MACVQVCELCCVHCCGVDMPNRCAPNLPACLPAWRSVQTAKRKYRHTLEAMHNGTLGQEKGEEGGCRAPWLPSIVFQSAT